jgi:nucleoside-triphosphatase THEP1
MNKLNLEVLRENIDKLNLSAEWVHRSYEQTKAIEQKDVYSIDEFDKLENLSSRYARTTDMLVNKVLRSIDTVESEDIGTIIDIMNRAEKRGIVESAELLHTIKDLRNNIVHEYQIAEITKFFANVIKYSPILLEIIKKVNKYCARYLDTI